MKNNRHEKIYNFSAGPAILPTEVLEKARAEMFSLDGCGRSVMELSHRSKEFTPVLAGAEQGLRELLNVPENYRILFLQGGASLQFSMIPQNFLRSSADYVINGAWSKKALREAAKFGRANVIYSSEVDNFRTVPDQDKLHFSADVDYVHYCSNETIDGVEFKYDLDAKGIPVVCDASSNILSKPIDVSKYALIYAGAQKNIGPSGVTVVIIREDLLEKVPAGLPAMLDFKNFADNDSMPNTPNTWGIYLIGLVCDWLKNLGGTTEIQKINEAKAKILYDTIDAGDGYFRGHAERAARSAMNITFRLPTEELEKKFCADAEREGFFGLKGHRSVGGIRASIYNAFPLEGAQKLAEFMQEFAAKNGI